MLTLARYTPRLLAVFTILQGVLAMQICNPEACIKGKSSSNILHTDSSTHNLLTPGQYPLYGDLSLFQSSLSAPLNQTSSRTGDTITLTYPARPAVFDQVKYKGRPESLGGVDWDVRDDWKSLYLPKDWYAVVGDGQVLWGPVVDIGELPSGVKTRISSASSSICDPPCSSNGICVSSTTSAATCQCRPGWTGLQCDQCVSGHFGPECKACEVNCTVCDSGLSGTGKCLGTAKDATACGCLHGTCTPTGDCTCSAGLTTNTTTSDKKCNTCIKGFYQTANGDCQSCPAGCSTCTLKAGTTDTPICLSCRSGLNLNTADPARCVSLGSCSDGQYWDNSTTTCLSCSPACQTCSGPSGTDCLACSAPRMNLEGQCVGLDARGVCDSSLASVQGVFIANNGIGKCDACPVGCATCNIPSFSSVSSFTFLQCSTCHDGYLLENGRCVKKCSPGWFLANPAEKTGICQQCSSSCAECQTSSTYCTVCPLPTTFAHLGSCAPSCPIGTIGLNSTCIPCHPDCSTCSSPSSSSCLSCPSNRPILSSGTCMDHCPKSSYFDPSSKECKRCDWTCSSCSSSDDGSCTSCADGYVLRGGKCKSANCGKGGFVHGSGLCLEDLVDKEDKRWIAGVVIGMLLIIGGLGGGWYIRRERRKRREGSKAFKEAMDVHGPTTGNGGEGIGLRRWFGFDRISPISTEATYATEGKEGSRGLKELLLPSSTFAKKSQNQDVGGKREDIELIQTKYEEAGIGRQSYSIPPPPYNPSPSSSSLSDTVKPLDFSIPQIRSSTSSSALIPSIVKSELERTIRQYEDDIDLLSEAQDLMVPNIPIPPRAKIGLEREEEREKEVYRPHVVRFSGIDWDESDGREEEIRRISKFEKRLSELWPNLGRNNRFGEGWV